MAFFSKVGNILRQTSGRPIASDLSRVNSSIFQAVRCMSNASQKIFLGGISWGTDDQSLKEECSKYGEVLEAKIIMDRETGRSRGFGFVTFSSVEEASSAIQAMDGRELHGRTIRVNYANERPRSNFGYGGYQGGDNNSGGGYAGSGDYGNNSGGGYAGAAGDYGNNSGGGSYGIGAASYDNNSGAPPLYSDAGYEAPPSFQNADDEFGKVGGSRN